MYFVKPIFYNNQYILYTNVHIENIFVVNRSSKYFQAHIQK